jgi:septum formation protein
METIILASASPRRQELLRLAGIPFIASPSRVNEIMSTTEDPKNNALRLSNQKLDVFLASSHSMGCSWVLAADTFIHFNGVNIGKPADRDEARDILTKIGGNQHTVYTGMSLFSKRHNRRIEYVEMTQVRLSKLSEETLDWYINTGEWQDSAGAYKIQGKAQCIIEEIKGSFSNVMGLPLHQLYKMLIQMDYRLD